MIIEIEQTGRLGMDTTFRVLDTRKPEGEQVIAERTFRAGVEAEHGRVFNQRTDENGRSYIRIDLGE